jgi:hypothetical protein
MSGHLAHPRSHRTVSSLPSSSHLSLPTVMRKGQPRHVSPRVPGVMAHIRIPKKIEKYVEEHHKGPAKFTKNTSLRQTRQAMKAEKKAPERGKTGQPYCMNLHTMDIKRLCIPDAN